MTDSIWRLERDEAKMMKSYPACLGIRTRLCFLPQDAASMLMAGRGEELHM
jgi:hypothetical protein